MDVDNKESIFKNIDSPRFYFVIHIMLVAMKQAT